MSDTLTNYFKFTRLLMIYQLEEKMGNNIILSPFSIQMLLSILSDATAGRTHREVNLVLQGGATGRGSISDRGRTAGQGNTNDREMEEWLINMQSKMKRAQAFTSANAVCLHPNFESSVNDEFKEHLKNFYDGEVFSSGNMVSDINQWVRKVSKGMINDIADESMVNAVAFMLNGVTFDSRWSIPYKGVDIFKGDFTNADGSVKKVPMMVSTEKYYLENKYFTGFLRPYKGQCFYFMGLLPKEEAIAAFHKEEQEFPDRNFWTHALYATDFSRLRSEYAEEYELRVIMPEFKAEHTTNLQKFFTRLGMKKIFSGGADFSPLTSKEIYLESIIQKAYIEVDPSGTRAAAITMGALPKCIEKHPKKIKYVRLDRPFLYAIVWCSNNMPVFEGILNYIDTTQ